MSTLTIYLARLIGLSAVLACRRPFGTRKRIDNGYGGRWPRYARLCDIQSCGGTSNHTRAQRLVRRSITVIVTLVGWLIFAKGLVLLLVTPETFAPLLERMQQHYHYPVYIVRP